MICMTISLKPVNTATFLFTSLEHELRNLMMTDYIHFSKSLISRSTEENNSFCIVNRKDLDIYPRCNKSCN